MTAGIDLALGLIERDLGKQASATHREGACRRIIAALAANRSIPQCCSSMPKSDRIQIALAFAKQNLRRTADG